jgi:hypothetical protein
VDDIRGSRVDHPVAHTADQPLDHRFDDGVHVGGVEQRIRQASQTLVVRILGEHDGFSSELGDFRALARQRILGHLFLGNLRHGSGAETGIPEHRHHVGVSGEDPHAHGVLGRGLLERRIERVGILSKRSGQRVE